MSVWIALVGAGLGSYLLRISMIVVAARFGLPPVLERAARYAVPAAFAALAASALASTAGLDVQTLPPFAAVLAGVLTVRWTGSPHSAILAGMPTLWILTAVVGA